MARYCIHCDSDDVIHAQLSEIPNWVVNDPKYDYHIWYCRYCKELANAVLIRESYQDRMEAKGWLVVPCSFCRGYGVYDAGYLEVSPEECPDCAGSGEYWVTPKGRTMDYPSGRFTGILSPEEYKKLRDKYGKQ